MPCFALKKESNNENIKYYTLEYEQLYVLPMIIALPSEHHEMDFCSLLLTLCCLLLCYRTASTDRTLNLRTADCGLEDLSQPLLIDTNAPPVIHRTREIKQHGLFPFPSIRPTPSKVKRQATTSSSYTSSGIGTSTALALPRPFDTSLGNNFTAPSCPVFFNNFLNDPTFEACHPASLLLQVRTASDFDSDLF